MRVYSATLGLRPVLDKPKKKTKPGPSFIELLIRGLKNEKARA